MRYLSLCSGIEAASVAWEPLGWTPVAFAELDSFPSAILLHRFPSVPNLGDINAHSTWSLEPGTVDLVVGGTPCQSFSVAGLRAGLADPRGNLALTFLAIVDRLRPEWVIFENVPGLLSANGGRDFGSFLGALAELRYGFAYRVLDARHFGVAQRRRRVFVVANATDWRRAAAVLFEPESLRRYPPTSRAKGQGAAASTKDCADTVGTICADSHPGAYAGQDAYTGRLIPAILSESPPPAPIVLDRAAFNQGENASYPPRIEASETMSSLVARGPHAVATPLAVPFVKSRRAHHVDDFETWQEGVTAPTLSTFENTGEVRATVAVTTALSVRRLTPVECERLQGFPDDWTSVPFRGKPASDAPRYKAIGNSMAVPVVRWIGERIAAIDKVTR
jgi:DNA (cytosine-5)-methyltransferase 1